ncbi:hypothetical protein ILYODFUR_025153 [Ilyodon furcidens]|uniref:Uncharacterized protein n=1 Tax=Ilyodon furcidens TaxID=33524 RepID=A0ABV0SP63_9TELE
MRKYVSVSWINMGIGGKTSSHPHCLFSLSSAEGLSKPPQDKQCSLTCQFVSSSFSVFTTDLPIQNCCFPSFYLFNTCIYSLSSIKICFYISEQHFRIINKLFQRLKTAE